MFWTYIIYSRQFDKYYVGFTHDLNSRLNAHNHPKNKGFTRKFQPWTLVYCQSFKTKIEAMEFEKYLKSLKSKKALNEFVMLRQL
jgi:putative endonuclease